jgi:hypothetical protein
MPIRAWGVVIGVVGTLAYLRVWVWVRTRELRAAVRSGQLTWGALARVARREATFLDAGGSRPGSRPAASLVVVGNQLQWRPSGYEAKHGYTAFSWSLRDVTCTQRRARRDITGVKMIEVTLHVPEGAATIVLYHLIGAEPGFLQAS